MVPSATVWHGACARKSRRQYSPRAVFPDRCIHQRHRPTSKSGHAHVSNHSINAPAPTRRCNWFIPSPDISQLACTKGCEDAHREPLPRAVGSNRYSCAALHRSRDVSRFSARSASVMFTRGHTNNADPFGWGCGQSTRMLAAGVSPRPTSRIAEQLRF